jgi:hypothetical protein
MKSKNKILTTSLAMVLLKAIFSSSEDAWRTCWMRTSSLARREMRAWLAATEADAEELLLEDIVELSSGRWSQGGMGEGAIGSNKRT